MPSDTERVKIRFDLANANFQAISRAQGIYVTALLAYLCYAWVNFFIEGSDVSLHLAWLELKVGGLSKINPFVLLILTLAYIGTLTAITSARAELNEAEKHALGTDEHRSFFAADTHKNIIDYMALLQLWPFAKTRTPRDFDIGASQLSRFPHLFLPFIFVLSAFTSSYSIWRMYRLASWNQPTFIFGCVCLLIQLAYSIRPIVRFSARFFGAKKTSVFYN